MFLTESIQSPLTGIGRYSYELGIRLKSHKFIEDIHFFHRLNSIHDLSQLIKSGENFSIRAAKSFKQNMLLRRCLRPPYRVLNNLMFLKTYKNFKDYIVHTPSYLLPPMSGKSVSTIHDLSHIVFPECHPKERVAYLNKFLPKTLERVSHIITVSNFSKNEMVKYFKFDETKITAIPSGIGSNFRPHSIAEIAPILTFLNLIPNQYLLSVATFEPRKNLIRLIDAYASLPNSLKQKYPLVLAGASGWLNRNLNDKIKRVISTENIKILGYVSHDQLPALYAGARGFAYPSLYEGFGFQVLEAMASGVPVLTSKNTSMDEVSGKIPILIDPMNTTDIKHGLEKLLLDDTWRQSTQLLGAQHAAQYTWEKCVDATIDIYKKVYETNK